MLESRLEEGPGAGMLNRILGVEVRDKHGKYGIRKCRRDRKYMRGKGRGMWGKYAGTGMLNRILKWEMRDKTGN